MISILGQSNLKIVVSGDGKGILRDAPAVATEIIRITGVEHPTILTISTAEPSLDSYNEFIELTKATFGAHNATVIDLHEYGKTPSQADVEAKINSADAIWVSGGDTSRMMEFWNKNGITERLNAAAKRGVVLSGGSAGMLAWMKTGFSDSLAYRVESGESWEYIFVEGLDLIHAVGVPHYEESRQGKARSVEFKQSFLADDSLPNIGIGFDNMAALSIVGNTYKVISTPTAEHPRADITIISKTDGGIEEYALPVSDEYKSFEL